MLKFIAAYLSDVWHLMTCRQRVPLRIGHSNDAFLVAGLPLVLWVLQGGQTSDWICAAIMTGTLVLGWYLRRGDFIAYSLMYLWSELWSALAKSLHAPSWLVITIAVLGYLLPMFAYHADLDSPIREDNGGRRHA